MSHPISNVVTQDDVDHVMINDGGTTSHSPPTAILPFFVQQRSDLISKSNFWLIHVKAHYRNGNFVPGYTRCVKLSKAPRACHKAMKSIPKVRYEAKMLMLQHTLNVEEFAAKPSNRYTFLDSSTN